MVLSDNDADKLIVAQKADEMLSEFVEEQLVKHTKEFFITSHKPKLQTFGALSKPIIVSDGGKRSTMKAGADLFQHLTVVAQN